FRGEQRLPSRAREGRPNLLWDQSRPSAGGDDRAGQPSLLPGVSVPPRVQEPAVHATSLVPPVHSGSARCADQPAPAKSGSRRRARSRGSDSSLIEQERPQRSLATSIPRVVFRLDKAILG